MSNVRIGQIYNTLACRFEVFRIFINCRDPAKCLMGRCNIVTIRGEDNEWIADSPQIDSATVANAEFTFLQLVADEKIFRNSNHFLAAQEVKTVPPPFKFKKPVSLSIDLIEQACIFLPDRFFRFEILEILRKPGTVKATVAKICCEMGHPDAAE